MNIFVLDFDPKLAAQYQCDKHVVKMLLETGQILSTVQRTFGSTSDVLYKSTHVNHPCTVWTRQSTQNYSWLYQHFVWLAREYNFRYNKPHKTWSTLAKALFTPPDTLPNTGRTPFALAMPDVYKVKDDPILSYRNYYKHAKASILKYTNREPPSWL